ncbi:hypothetical protein VC279_01210 [Xanthomonas sp. WHRI 10064A]|uniref:hypothetical protein n=1 Tax=unclassified Xanthomonas TaxID=2643310 RepID=UPI002B22C337|nr:MULTISPECIES: hypothetical protein [unclassified Xanthomonas]MEA9588422.1 hypothetical protein [Xanthomonas sp. WHRI 10064B]MEA9613407.1 hypothetical protein [Xanthomonas sp. WHRI 10064A]
MSKRQAQAPTAPLDRILIDVRAIAAQWSFVTSVSDHFAGYFNELGLTLTIAPDAIDQDLVALQNELLVYLDAFWEKNTPTFTWMVMFSDETKTMAPLILGDSARSASDLRV